MPGSTSLVKRTRLAKLNALAGKFAFRIAAKRNDPMIQRYNKLNRKRLILKKAIIKRYHAAAIQLAKQVLGKNKDKKK